MSGLLLPVEEGRCIYGGGTSAGGGVAGGATVEGADGDDVTGGGVTGGGTIAAGGGGTAHPMMVLSIPRPRHITYRRATIDRTPYIHKAVHLELAESKNYAMRSLPGQYAQAALHTLSAWHNSCCMMQIPR